MDIRVQLSPDVSLDRLAGMYEFVKQTYPNRRERISWHGGIQFRPGTVPEFQQVEGGADGYVFSSLDGKQLVQGRLDGFTFNKLKPYERWETFREEAKRLWQIYSNVANPKQVTRVALRYINSIEIPLPMKDFKDYILTLPEIARGIPQGLERYFMRLVIPSDELQAVAVVTQSMQPVPDPNKIPVIFDIDVIRQAAFDIHSSEMWDAFETLHDFKNDIFFKSITEKAKELFR